jgi:hypothetical protein
MAEHKADKFSETELCWPLLIEQFTLASGSFGEEERECKGEDGCQAEGLYQPANIE